jgi:hypothetical protein
VVIRIIILDVVVVIVKVIIIIIIITLKTIRQLGVPDKSKEKTSSLRTRARRTPSGFSSPRSRGYRT